MADILHVEPLISAITSGPKMIDIFGKLNLKVFYYRKDVVIAYLHTEEVFGVMPL